MFLSVLEYKSILYIIIAAVLNLGVDVDVVCDFSADPLSLADICRQTIRRQIGKNRLRDVGKLPLPTSLQNYLLYQ